MAVPLTILDLRYLDRAYRRGHLFWQLRYLNELPGLIEQPPRIEEPDAPKFQPHPILRNLGAAFDCSAPRGHEGLYLRITQQP